MNEITVYTTDPCPFCRQAKALLTKRGFEYSEINLSKDPAGRAQLAQRTGMMTFPQVVIGDHLVGGYDQLAEADRAGELAHLVVA